MGEKKLSKFGAMIATVMLAGVLGVTGLSVGADKKNQNKDQRKKAAADTMMVKKLDHSKDILEGLAQEDFEKIVKGGEALKAISSMDEFMKYNVLAYQNLAGEFRVSVDRMVKAAKVGNLDGATLGFNQMTVSCVECHKMIRDGGLIKGLDAIQ